MLGVRKHVGLSVPGFAIVLDARTAEKTKVLRSLASNPTIVEVMQNFNLCVPVIREMTLAEELPSKSSSGSLVLGHNANFGTDHIAMRINKYNPVTLESTTQIMDMGPYGKANTDGESLIDTLLHELAHCDHGHHGKAFQDRRNELKAFYLSKLPFSGTGRKAVASWSDSLSASFATITRRVQLLCSQLKTTFYSATSLSTPRTRVRGGKAARLPLARRSTAGAGAGAGARAGAEAGKKRVKRRSSAFKAAVARMGPPRTQHPGCSMCTRALGALGSSQAGFDTCSESCKALLRKKPEFQDALRRSQKVSDMQASN